ncbi:MAG: DNA-directed RNA polymerase subunit D [Candidatus Nanohaloarchaea archaeon]
MDIEIIEEGEDEIEFELEGTSPEFANSLRRTMIGNVPTLAVEDVKIVKNNSGLFDEIVAHRLGMIPWEFDPEKYNVPEDCDCEDGCPKCQVSMALQADGEGTVTAEDISVPSDDVEAREPETPVARLNEDGEMELEMVAQLGLGKDHAKWQAANASYSYDGETFHFQVETVSGLDPRTVVTRAVERLEKGLDEFEEEVEKDL